VHLLLIDRNVCFAVRIGGIVTGFAESDWQKGGLRYAKLQGLVPEFLKPASVCMFFVGVRSQGGSFRLFNPLSPLQKEYVVAATDDGIAILWLRRPGVFRASIGGIVYKSHDKEANVQWDDGKLLVAGVAYEPIAFHDEDAEGLARLVNERR